jgi:hypothetical protein
LLLKESSHEWTFSEKQNGLLLLLLLLLETPFFFFLLKGGFLLFKIKLNEVL